MARQDVFFRDLSPGSDSRPGTPVLHWFVSHRTGSITKNAGYVRPASEIVP
jgi:hypothetical protein